MGIEGVVGSSGVNFSEMEYWYVCTAWIGKAAASAAAAADVEDEGGKLPPSASLILASASREARPPTTEASRVVGTTFA